MVSDDDDDDVCRVDPSNSSFYANPYTHKMPSVHLVKKVEKLAQKIQTGAIVIGNKKGTKKKNGKAPIYDIWGSDEKKAKIDDEDEDAMEVSRPSKKVR